MARSRKSPHVSKSSPRSPERRFAQRLLAWYERNGRKDLPWKRSRDPYAIWVSEIMLQQTQVATVIPYYERFMRRFPTVQHLARAGADAVLHLWTGLGYYARARHLHEAARQIVLEHAGAFPRDFASVAALPGVGRSTAGAILALAFGARHAILDGNVKRVLARYYAIATPVNDGATLARLWETAERLTPRTRVADYTQAIMDLGATVCKRRAPDCAACPLRCDCRAAARGAAEAYPVMARRRVLPAKRVKMLLIQDAAGRVLLTQRPPAGLWGGLWSLPQCEHADVRAFSRTQLGLDIAPERAWPSFRHTFSHFHLDIMPIPARVLGPSRQRCATARGTRASPRNAIGVMETDSAVWYNVRHPDARGMPAPVKRLLDQLMAPDMEQARRRLQQPSRNR